MQANAGHRWDDRRIEETIAYLLRAGVLVSALLVAAGGALHLLHHGREFANYGAFLGEPESLRTVRGLLAWETLRHGTGLIQLGLVVLIFTPIARVAFALLAFAGERDWIYVVVSAIVLGLLLYSFTSA